MSRVTNVILKLAAGDHETDNSNAADILNMACAAFINGCCPFVEAEYCAGSKHLEVQIYLGAFNHLDLDDFRKSIESVPWEYPEYVQLFVQEEYEERFHEVGLWERQS